MYTCTNYFPEVNFKLKCFLFYVGFWSHRLYANSKTDLTNIYIIYNTHDTVVYII